MSDSCFGTGGGPARIVGEDKRRMGGWNGWVIGTSCRFNIVAKMQDKTRDTRSYTLKFVMESRENPIPPGLDSRLFNTRGAASKQMTFPDESYH